MPAKVTIDGIESLDKTSSDTDIRLSIATELKNFSTTRRPGSIVKSGAYTDSESSLFGQALGSVGTLKNIAELNLNQPSTKAVYFIHTLDSGQNHLYMAPYYDGSSFQNGERKMTESEGEYTADSGTTASQIVDSELSSSVDDYYNGWVVTVDRGGTTTAAIVQDYVGSTKTLSLPTNAITGLTTGDTYYISRSPVIGYSPSSATLGGIASVDDIVRFSSRYNSLICSTGSENSFPDQYQLWVGYINKIYGSTDGTGTTKEIDGFFLELQQMLKPYVKNSPPAGRGSVLEATAGGSGGSLTVGQWKLFVAYEYDDGFIGPLSTAYNVTVGSAQEIDVTVRIPVESGDVSGTFYTAYEVESSDDLPTNFSGHLVSKRVTGVRLYALKPGSSTAPDESAQLVSVSTSGATDDHINPVPISSHINDTVSDEIAQFISPGYSLVEWNFDENPTGNSYTTDINSSGTKSNFKYSVSLDDHFIVSNIRAEGDKSLDAAFIASTVQANGVANLDNFGARNITNLGFYGAQEITGMSVIGDSDQTTSPKRRILIFTKKDLFILQITSGSSYSYSLDKTSYSGGAIAPNAIVSAGINTYYVGINGFRKADHRGSQEIGYGLKNDFDALTSKVDAIGGYLERERIVIFTFPTDNKSYAVDLLNNDNMYELSYSDAMTFMFQSNTGDLYGSDGSNVFKLEDGTTQNGTVITPLLKSKKITAKDFKFSDDDHLKLIEGYVRYKSNTAIKLNAYLDGSSTALSFNNLNLPSKTTEDDVRFKFPIGSNCKDVQIELTLTTTQASTNTSFDVNKITLIAEKNKRLI